MVQFKGTGFSSTTLPPPEIVGLLPNVPGGQTNLLPEALTHADLKVWFTVPLNSSPELAEETVELFVDGSVTALVTRKWNKPIEDSDRYLAVPQAWLRSNDGERRFKYKVTIYNDETEESSDLVMTLDTQAPMLPTNSKLIFPPEVLPPNQITAAYLADPAHQDQVVVTLPDYSPKVGDAITTYWERSPGGREIAGTRTLEPGDIGKPVQVFFKGDLLRNSTNNVDYYATYRVRDRAGSESTLSVDEKLSVNIRPPTPRKFPTVKQATNSQNGTGVLNPFLGISGVTVVVAGTEIDPGEEVTVDFIGLGGEGGIGSAMGVKPTTPGGLEFAIAASVVAANIPVGGDGRTSEVSYRAGRDIQPSAKYTLAITELGGQTFGSVGCPEAQIGSPATLSRNKVEQSGATIEMEKWAYHEDTHLINVWALASSVRTDFLEGAPTPLNANRKFTTPLPKDYVAALPLNSMFTLHASVSFDQGQSYRAFKPMSIKLVT
ncbi:hypothetical protein [Pseudomonas neuropathica]|uniref:Uncharacterized protein n=1 Tax=Pseudomonas neuropathica TaxID=2730425 RepID=A0ACC7MVY8_9PSED